MTTASETPLTPMQTYLKALCSKETWSRNEWTKWVWYWPERDITIATDAKRLAIVKGDHTDKDGKRVDNDVAQAKRFEGVIDRALPLLGTTTAEDLKTFTGEEDKPKKEECDLCDGDGSHECRCGDRHECGQCDGEGEIDCSPDPRHGRIGHLVIDCNLLAPLLAPFAGSCDIRADKHNPDPKVPSGMLRLDAHDKTWSLLLMSMSGDQVPNEMPVFGGISGPPLPAP